MTPSIFSRSLTEKPEPEEERVDPIEAEFGNGLAASEEGKLLTEYSQFLSKQLGVAIGPDAIQTFLQQRPISQSLEDL